MESDKDQFQTRHDSKPLELELVFELRKTSFKKNTKKY